MIAYAGATGPGGTGTGATETWDGSSWTEVNDMAVARFSVGFNGGASTTALAWWK